MPKLNHNVSERERGPFDDLLAEKDMDMCVCAYINDDPLLYCDEIII